MKTLVLAALIVGISTTAAHAATQTPATTATQVDSAAINQGLAEGTPVRISGEIAKHLQGDTYVLQDSAGTVEVEIDRDLTNRQVLPNGTQLDITGQVDLDDGRPQVDVNRVNTIQGVDPANSVLATTSDTITSTTTEGTSVRLQGQITRHLGEDTYQFQDNAGTIEVEIDRDLTGQQVLPNGTQIDVTGTVDHDDGRIQVDVNRVNTAQGIDVAR